METVTYREQNGQEKYFRALRLESRVSPEIEDDPLSPEKFYPPVSKEEAEMWRLWLPTAVTFCRVPCFNENETRTLLTKVLGGREVPSEVLEEFIWSWQMGMFETYQVRTPVRRDARDPLLLGLAQGKWYRIALWGESLLPLKRIKELVKESLELRDRASRRRRWLIPLSALGAFGLSLAVYLFPQFFESHETLALLAALAGVLALIMNLARTAENVQHDFLDRYRVG